MTPLVQKKLEAFLSNEELQEKFEKILLTADLSDILWPEDNPAVFGRVFTVVANRKKVVYPLCSDTLKIRYLELKVHSVIKHVGGVPAFHPAVAYLYLALYESQIRSSAVAKRKPSSSRSAKKKGRKKPSGTERPVLVEISRRELLERVHKLQKKLSVPRKMRLAKSPADLLPLVFAEVGKLAEAMRRLSQKNENIEMELAVYRNPDFMHKEHRKFIESLSSENENLRERVRNETSRCELLEREVARLAEQIIARPEFSQRSQPHSPSDEYESLRLEYNLLSQKYDSLVSKNIELSNQLDKASTAKSLEGILNLIRDRINGSLRAGIAGNREGDQALLRGLQGEISQLQRARMYLGRVLFDVGMLYLRLGQKERAVAEFRAARELGIEDPEMNRLINNPSS